ncbi:hypothetical protein F5883DRAFT_574634 [Diaporthe sp. PMI_573]|nr:hypothetical protein F5883DRAFT_574634 [Diaporthaceae sp. PMI_573]
MDPFTIVTGGAGLLSTSITVCHGLINYCRSYRSREEDPSGLQHNSERLKNPITASRNSISDRAFHGSGLQECHRRMHNLLQQVP